jgi:hypothetical protein
LCFVEKGIRKVLQKETKGTKGSGLDGDRRGNLTTKNTKNTKLRERFILDFGG